MYLPKIYEKFSSKFPEVLKDYQQLGKTCRESGPLEKKYQDLANLGIAIGANGQAVAAEVVGEEDISGSPQSLGSVEDGVGVVAQLEASVQGKSVFNI